MPINRSFEFFKVEDCGSECNRSIVSSFSFAISKSDKSVNSGFLGGKVPVGDGEEGSNMVDIDKHTPILTGGGDVILTG